MVFHWSTSDNKSLQVAGTHLSILTDLNNAVVWMVTIRPLIFTSIRLRYQAPIIIGITVTHMFDCFFLVLWQGPSISLSLSLSSLSLNFTLWSAVTLKSAIRQVFFFCCLLTLVI